jgi:hypothetical protein
MRAQPGRATDLVETVAAVENPLAGQGMVVLDIGGDIGALIVTASAALAGAEIEICPAGARANIPDEGAGWWQGEWRGHSPAAGHSHSHSHADGHRHQHDTGPAWPHVAVLGRPTGDEIAYGAVYPGLRAGSYELWLRDGDAAPALFVEVLGGQVTSVEWPAMALEPSR